MCEHEWETFVSCIGLTGKRCKKCGDVVMDESDCNEETLAEYFNV